MQYSLPFVPNKKGYKTFILHALGCYFAYGKRLFCTPDKDGKINPYLIPHIFVMVIINVSGWLTKGFQQYLPAEVPKE